MSRNSGFVGAMLVPEKFPSVYSGLLEHPSVYSGLLEQNYVPILKQINAIVKCLVEIRPAGQRTPKLCVLHANGSDYGS
jgi:hypothetical protein